MENELNKLIEQQNKEYEKQTLGYDDDDARSNVDIDDFEQKLKMNKSRMGFDDDSSDDDVPSYKKKSSKQAPIKKPEYQLPKQTRPLLSDEPDLLRQVQEMHQNKNKAVMTKSSKSPDTQTEVIKQKQDAQQRVEEEKALEILNSNNAGLKEKKLKELIQKNKELYVSLEREKTMRQKLQRDIERIKEETDMQLAVMDKKPKGANKQDDDSGDWKRKYIDFEKKLQESKLQNSTMKNELNKAMRVIAKEIGENVSIDTILSQENSWKGRAQQIEVLKARVKELQSKVSASANFPDMSYITDKSQDMSNIGHIGGDKSTARSMTMGGLKKREEIEALKGQADSLKTDNDALTEKVKALNSRKTILEKELKDTRNEFERAKQILMEKSANDDKYIAALKREVDKARVASPTVQTRIVYRDKPTESKRNEPDDMEDTMARKELNILKNELEKREKIIKELINEKLKNETVNMHRDNVIHENIPDQEKIVKLETMIKILKQENEELSNLKLGIKGPTPDSKLIKDLSLQNAQLRRKLDDLQSKMK